MSPGQQTIYTEAQPHLLALQHLATNSFINARLDRITNCEGLLVRLLPLAETYEIMSLLILTIQDSRVPALNRDTHHNCSSSNLALMISLKLDFFFDVG